MKAVLIAGAFLLILEGTVRAQEPDKSRHTQHRQLNNSAGAPRWQVLDINNLWTWHRSDGVGNHSPSGFEGLSFPKFTGFCIYEDNVIVGGKVYVGGFPETGGTLPATQHIRVNGGEYLSNHGMDEGWVEGFGASASPVDKNLPDDGDNLLDCADIDCMGQACGGGLRQGGKRLNEVFGAFPLQAVDHLAVGGPRPAGCPRGGLPSAGRPGRRPLLRGFSAALRRQGGVPAGGGGGRGGGLDPGGPGHTPPGL